MINLQLPCMSDCMQKFKTITLSRDIGYLLFWKTCLTTTNKNDIAMVALTNVWLHEMNQDNHSSLSRDGSNLLFLTTLGMPGNDNISKNDKINSQFPSMPDSMRNIKTITQLFPEILEICYLEALWVCTGMSDSTQLKWYGQF